MENKIIKKMARYVELSTKFSKSERDIFTEEELKVLHTNNSASIGGGYDSFTIGTTIGTTGTNINMSALSNHITLNGVLVLGDREIYVDKSGNVKSRNPKKPLTRGEVFELNTMVKVKERATLLDEYDEYNKLRTALKQYLDGANDLINE
jgi:hypothetical protein